MHFKRQNFSQDLPPFHTSLEMCTFYIDRLLHIDNKRSPTDQ